MGTRCIALLFHSADSLTLIISLVGEIVIDIADVESIDLRNVLLHTMGSILGIGTGMSDKSTTARSELCSLEKSSQTSNEWRCLSGCNDELPIMSAVCGHWDEACIHSSGKWLEGRSTLVSDPKTYSDLLLHQLETMQILQCLLVALQLLSSTILVIW